MAVGVHDRAFMPPEWAEHERTWMIYPPAVYEGAASLEAARAAWCAVARAVAGHEPVAMAVRPEDAAAARADLGGAVELVEMALDDAWARDVAPSFVRSHGHLLAVDWAFNGWGGQSWARWDHDDQVAGEVARHLGVPRERASILNEGGGIEVNGSDAVLVTETVQLDPGRNGPGARDAVEGELRRLLGVSEVRWLARGLAGDYEEFGTRGHVDLVAKFVAPDVALYHDQRNANHPDHALSRATREALEAWGYEAVPLPAPAREEVGGRTCDWSYVNCYFVNGGLVAGTFEDAADDEALAVLRSLSPRREVVAVDARTLFALGGGVHCVTQQQPR
jgi:agmatine deiminase